MKIDRSKEYHPTEWRVVVTLSDGSECIIYRKGLTDFEYYQIAKANTSCMLAF